MFSFLICLHISSFLLQESMSRIPDFPPNCWFALECDASIYRLITRTKFPCWNRFFEHDNSYFIANWIDRSGRHRISFSNYVYRFFFPWVNLFLSMSKPSHFQLDQECSDTELIATLNQINQKTNQRRLQWFLFLVCQWLWLIQLFLQNCQCHQCQIRSNPDSSVVETILHLQITFP